MVMLCSMRVQADLKSSPSLVDATLSIGEVAEQAGMSTSAIRYYEERGLIAPVARDGGRRRFAPSAVRRLWLIDLCTSAGFSLDETRVLLADRGRRRAASRALAEQKLVDLDAQIAQLRSAKELIAIGLRCTCRSLEECGCEADVWCELTVGAGPGPTGS